MRPTCLTLFSRHTLLNNNKQKKAESMSDKDMSLKSEKFSSLSAVQQPRAIMINIGTYDKHQINDDRYFHRGISCSGHFSAWIELLSFQIKWHHTFLVDVPYKALSEIRVPFAIYPYNSCCIWVVQCHHWSALHCNHSIKWYLSVTCLLTPLYISIDLKFSIVFIFWNLNILIYQHDKEWVSL